MARLRRYETEGARPASRGFSRSRLSAMAVIALALIPALPGMSPAETLTVERVGAAARAEIAESRYQRTLPKPPKPEPPELDEETREPPSFQTDPPAIPPRVREPESTGDVARMVLWVLVAIVGVLMVVFIANEFPRLLRRRSDPGADRADRADRAVPDEADPHTAPGDLLHEADRLARDGSYGPAIHVMLLALIDTLHGPIGRRLARSLTGREIVGAAGLAARSGAALSRIVAAAERSHFGGHRLNRADYETCRRDYAAVAADIGDRA